MAEVIVSSVDNLKQQISAGKHTLIADEPREAQSLTPVAAAQGLARTELGEPARRN